MLIAVKVEEIISPAAANSLYYTDSSYSETEALQAERHVLKTVDRNVSFPNPTYFLRRISNVYQHHIQIRLIAEYLTGIRCLESDLCITLRPCGVLGRQGWVCPYLSPTHIALLTPRKTPNLAHRSFYAESTLTLTANVMPNYILEENATHSNMPQDLPREPRVLTGYHNEKDERSLCPAPKHFQIGYNSIRDRANELLECSEKLVKREAPSLTLPSPLPQQVCTPPNVIAANQARFFERFKPDTPTFRNPLLVSGSTRWSYADRFFRDYP